MKMPLPPPPPASSPPLTNPSAAIATTMSPSAASFLPLCMYSPSVLLTLDYPPLLSSSPPPPPPLPCLFPSPLIKTLHPPNSRPPSVVVATTTSPSVASFVLLRSNPSVASFLLLRSKPLCPPHPRPPPSITPPPLPSPLPPPSFHSNRSPFILLTLDDPTLLPPLPHLPLSCLLPSPPPCVVPLSSCPSSHILCHCHHHHLPHFPFKHCQAHVAPLLSSPPNPDHLNR